MSRLPALALLLLAAPLPSVAATRRIDEKVPAQPGGTLTLQTPVGSVRIEGSDAEEAVLTVIVKGDQKRVDAFTVAAEAGKKGVGVVAKDPVGGSGSFSADFRLKVPKKYSLSVRTGGGGLRVAGLSGSVELETSGGAVRVSKVSGDVRARSYGGSIEVSEVAGAVEARTSGGGIQVSSSGGPVQARTSGGAVDVTVLKGYGGVRAESSGGGVTVSVPKGTAADVDASTDGGRVRCDLPVTVTGEIAPGRLKGPANGGGKPLVAHTSGGSVTVRSFK